MELYKKEKINPVAGCWPVLIQIPVFFALYKVLFVTIEMRHAPFFGWIRDLAAPDPTIGLQPVRPPALRSDGRAGDRPLPACSASGRIIMGITMWLQMKMNPEPPDPVQKQVFAWMPLIFTFMLASFPAGLVIYWAWNNLLSVTQQYFIMRKQRREGRALGQPARHFRQEDNRKSPGQGLSASSASAFSGKAASMMMRTSNTPGPGRPRAGKCFFALSFLRKTTPVMIMTIII